MVTNTFSNDKEIENINNKVEAEKFLQLAINQFDLSELAKIKIKDLINFDLENSSWIEFLEFLGFNYSKNEFVDGDIMDILWSPDHSQGRIIINNGVEVNHEDFSKTFDSLKELNDKEHYHSKMELLGFGVELIDFIENCKKTLKL